MVIKLQTARVLFQFPFVLSATKYAFCLKCDASRRLECFLKATYELQYLVENKLETAQCRKAIFRQ